MQSFQNMQPQGEAGKDGQHQDNKRPNQTATNERLTPPTLPLGNVKHPEARKIDRHYLKVMKVVELTFQLSYA